jgi:hypothetical protein
MLSTWPAVNALKIGGSRCGADSRRLLRTPRDGTRPTMGGLQAREGRLAHFLVCKEAAVSVKEVVPHLQRTARGANGDGTPGLRPFCCRTPRLRSVFPALGTCAPAGLEYQFSNLTSTPTYEIGCPL